MKYFCFWLGLVQVILILKNVVQQYSEVSIIRPGSSNFKGLVQLGSRLYSGWGRIKNKTIFPIGIARSSTSRGDCRFIPAHWGSQQQIFAILLFSKTFRYINDKKCNSIYIFFLKNNNKIFLFLLHKIQTPGINMQNGRQVI